MKMVDNNDEKQDWIEKLGWRFLILIISAVAGVFVYFYVVPFAECWFEVEIDDPLRQLPATLPTLIALWYFRTYDTRQPIANTNSQIEKADMQIQQSSFVNGFANLFSDDPLKIDIGTKGLIDVSERTKTTGEFDEQIRLAFIKRLQRLPPSVKPALQHYERNRLAKPAGYGTFDFDKNHCISIMDERIPYTKRILKWIDKHPNRMESFELRDIDFYYYEFAMNNTSHGKSIADPDKPTYTIHPTEGSISEALGAYGKQSGY